jgi:hypothetical protein
MIPVNAQGQTIGNDVCEETFVSEHKTMQICMKQMDKEMKKIRNSPFNSFDWQVSCQEE